MATEKVLNTRICLKYDSYANWQLVKDTFVPKKGEICIVAIPTGTNVTGVTNPPAIMMKCGDGTTVFDRLPWTQAVASDVYSWAKAANKPSYSAEEISGLAEFISGEIQDTDTQYKIVKINGYQYKLMSKGKNDAEYTTEVAVIDIPNDTAEINALKALVGDTAVATQIANAITELDLANTYEAKGSANAVKTALLGDAADEYNTLGKLEDAVLAVKATAESKTTMAEVEAKGYATTGEAQGYANAVLGTAGDGADKNTVYGAKKYADTLNTAMDGRVDALEAAIGEGGSVSTQITNAINALDVDEVKAGAGYIIDSVSETDGKVKATTRALAEADIPALSIAKTTGLQDALDAKQATVVWQSGNYDPATNKAITKSDLDAAVAGLAGAVHFIGVKGELPGTANNGDICIVGNKEYVYSTSDSAWHELGDETIYAVKGAIKDIDIAADAAIAQSKVAGLVDALAAKANTADLGTMAAENKADYVAKADALGYDDILTKTSAGTTYETKADATAKLTEAKGYTDTAIQGLDVPEVAVGTGEILSAISEADGKIAVTKRALVANDIPELAISKITNLQSSLDAKANDADLAAIAKSGNVNDLIQTSGDVLVFDCGGSTGN